MRDVGRTFNLPTLTHRVPMMFADGTAHPLGSTYDGYVPNITGTINSSRIGYWDDATKSGAFSDSYKRSNGSAAGYDTGHKPLVIDFKASNSSAAYGRNSSEFGGFVLPRAVHMYYIVKY